MGPDLKSSPFHRQLRAALDGLRELTLPDLKPAALLVALTVVGDALRLGVELPPQVMRAVEALPDDTIRAACWALSDETATWRLPVEPDPAGDLVDYAWAVRRRDEAESVIVAVRRVMVPRGALPVELEEFRRLAGSIARFDFTCGRRLGRPDAERALGERVILATPDAWVEALPDLDRAEGRDEEAAEAEEVEEVTDDPLLLTVPSDASVDAYVTEGRLAAWIEGAAGRSAAFAEELEGMIDVGLIAGDAQVSSRAIRWLSERRGETAADQGPMPEKPSLR